MSQGEGGPTETEGLQALIGELLEASANHPLTPPPDFDEEAYLAAYADVAEAVQAGRLASGFEHYWHHGRHEGRQRFSRLA